MRIGSLFSGCGGLDLAVKALFPDASTAWVSDIDPGACKVLAHRFPGVPNLGDITAVDWSAVEPVDILTGGFPCQDVSTAGKRAGIRPGTRSGLWAHMAYAVDQLRPPLVVIENVRGLLSAEAHSDVEPCPWCVGDDPERAMRALGAVLADLVDIGYDAEWVGVRAADVGACHGRFRVFVTAHPANVRHEWGGRARGGWAGPADGRLLPTPTRRDYKDTVIRREPHRPDDTDTLARALTLLPTPAVNDMGRGKTPEDWDAWTDRMKAEHGNGNGHGKSLDIEVQRLLPTPRATDGTKGGPNQRGSSGDLMLPSAVQQWGDYAAAIATWEHALGRPAPDPTETSTKGNPRLSPRFTEWMMGLPDGWITDAPGITRNEALKACGNGVVPQQAAAALRWLLDVREAS